MRRIVATVALLALTLGACSFRAQPDVTLEGTPRAGRTQDAGGAQTGGPGGPDRGSAGGSSPGTRGPGGGTSTGEGAKLSGDAHPPRAGLYRYRATDAAGRETGTIRLQIGRATDAAGGAQQTHDWDVGVVFTYLYRPDRLDVLEATTGGDCRFDPPVVTLRFPLRVGDSWRTDTRCAGPQTAAHEVHEGRVVRTEARTVGGRRVETFVVEKSITQYHVDGTTGSETQTHWVSPDHRLVVRRERRIPGDAASLATWDLLDLEPS